MKSYKGRVWDAHQSWNLRLHFYLSGDKVRNCCGVHWRIETVLNLDGGYIRLMLKMMGITYVAQFAAEICKDAGYGAVGSQIELFGKVSILFVSMPVLLALLQTVGDFL